MSWSDVDNLDRPQYEELSSITRSVHLRDAMISFGKQRLQSHKIETRNAKVNAKVLWFAPTKPMNQNNTYGNVSFTLDWSRAMDHLGPYLYYIDQKRTDDIVYSRVLMTNKSYINLTSVNTNSSRMPLWNLGGKYHVATACDGVTHVVEIGIEADARRGKWLYANCKIQANDHSSANKRQYPGGPYNPCICHRFNYFDKVCPSPYSAYQTRAILNKKCPTMLRDSPSWNHDQAVVEVTSAIAQMLGFADDDDDKHEYEDGEYIDNYDDHEKVTRRGSRLQTVLSHTACSRPPTDSDNDDEGYSFGASRGGSSYSGGVRNTPSYGAYRAESSCGFGGHGRSQTGGNSSDDVSHRSMRASGFQQTAARQEQDEGWSTGGKVALAAGGLALFAGLAAAFTAGSEEEKKKETKSWWE